MLSDEHKWQFAVYKDEEETTWKDDRCYGGNDGTPMVEILLLEVLLKHTAS